MSSFHWYFILGGLVATTLSSNDTSAEEVNDCGQSWNYIHRACYLFARNQEKSWDDAQKYCQADYGDLVSISDVTESIKIKNHLKTFNSSLIWWVGLHRKGRTNDFEWLDKTPLSMRITPWEPGEPDDRGGQENCVEMSFDGELNDRNCTIVLRPFICERHNNTFAEEVKDCGQSWNYIHRACYLFARNQEKSWDDAQKYCQADDGDLVSISDMTESRAIQNHLKNFQSSLMWWVGLHRKRRTTVFEWLDKTPLSIRVTPWKPGEPNDRGGQENCVEMSFDGKLNDRNCTTVLRPFICERHNITPTPVKYTTTPITTSITEPTTQAMEIRTTITTFISSSVGSTLSSTDESSITTESELEQTTYQKTAYLQSTQATAALHTRRPFIERSSPSTFSVIDNRDNEPSKSRDKDTTTQTTKIDIDNLDERLDRLYEQYKGCFMLDSKRYRKLKFLYTPGESTCPEVHASRITWPETAANVTSRRPCHSGEGMANFYCGGDPVCWRNQPDMDECASPKFKKILNLLSMGTSISQTNVTMAASKVLADITKSDDVSEDDVVAACKILSSLAISGAATQLKDDEIKNVISNVIITGSNLMDDNKRQLWTEMSKHDRVYLATSLTAAMEIAIVDFAQLLDKPTIINQKNKDIELQVRVLDVSSASNEAKEVVFNSEYSESSFTIPFEVLKTQFSQGGLARVVCMIHYSMGNILSGMSKDDSIKGSIDTETDESRQEESTLATHILSVTVGGVHKGVRVKLLQNITFMMPHLKPVPDGYTPISLCSYLDVGQNNLGEWSQDGCQADRTNASHTTCECDHLTNFAVLMNVLKVENSLSDNNLETIRDDLKKKENPQLQSEDVANLVSKVEQNLGGNATVSTSNETKVVVDILNELFQTSTEELKTAESTNGSASRLLGMVETLLTKVELTNDQFQTTSTQLFVAVRQNVTSGLTLTAYDKDFNGNFEGDEVKIDFNSEVPKEESVNSLVLPDSLFTNNNLSSSRIILVSYLSDNLYEVVRQAHAGNQTKAPKDTSYVRKINSHVLAASIIGSNFILTDPIVITLVHHEKNSKNATCVFWNDTQKDWSTKGCELDSSSSTQFRSSCRCDHLTSFALLMDVYQEGESSSVLSALSIIGCCVSLSSLLITIITYGILIALGDKRPCLKERREQRDVPHKILLNLCSALVLSNVVYLTGWIEHIPKPPVVCKVAAAMLHFFLLGAFCWMAVEAYYMYLVLVQVFKTNFTNFALKCSIFGWGVPLLVVAITLGVNKTDNYQNIQDNVCWLKGIAFYVAFVTPVCLVLVMNFAIFGLVLRRMMGLSGNKSISGPSFTVKRQLRGAIGVIILLGLTWIFAFLNTNKASPVFAYLFVIFNPLQGTFIFLYYCIMREDIRVIWLRWLYCGQADVIVISNQEDFTSRNAEQEHEKHPENSGKYQVLEEASTNRILQKANSKKNKRPGSKLAVDTSKTTMTTVSESIADSEI